MYIIDLFLGYYTGSVYNDNSLKKAGFLGESKRDGSVIAIKSHDYKKIRHCDKAIILIRNPYKALIAKMNRRTSASHIYRGDADIFKLKGELWHRYMRPPVVMELNAIKRSR